MRLHTETAPRRPPGADARIVQRLSQRHRRVLFTRALKIDFLILNCGEARAARDLIQGGVDRIEQIAHRKIDGAAAIRARVAG